MLAVRGGRRGALRPLSSRTLAALLAARYPSRLAALVTAAPIGSGWVNARERTFSHGGELQPVIAFSDAGLPGRVGGSSRRVGVHRASGRITRDSTARLPW